MKLIKKVIYIFLIIMTVLTLILMVFVYTWPSFGKKPSREKKSEYARRTRAFYDGTFHTPEEFHVLVNVKNKTDDMKAKVKPKGEIPVTKMTELPNVDIEDLTITWFGHSTSLLQIHGMTVLIDPVLSEYASPVGFAGAKRMAEVPMNATQLPEIDLLLISHDHYDHLDYQTIKQIDGKVKQYCVPLGVENHLERWGVDPDKIYTMAWWDDVKINGLQVSATPGQHYTGRIPWQKNQTLWCGYILQDAYHKVYYTGDTGYGEFFKEIRERYGEPELILSEDGQYDKRWPYTHMKPVEVLTAAEDMGAKWMIPVHWAGFVLSRHAWYEPAEQLTNLAEHSEVSIATPEIGETVNMKQIADYQKNWWEEVK